MGEGSDAFLSKYLIKKRNSLVSRNVKGKTLLDIGCDRGNLKEYLSKEIDYVGIDVKSKEFFKLKCKYIQMDVEDNLSSLGEVECITMVAVIEHLKNPKKAIKNIFEILKPSGRLIITTPTKLGDKIYQRMSKIGLVSSNAARQHQSIFDVEDLTKLLKSEGFDIVKAHTFEFGLNQLVIAKKPSRNTEQN